MKATSPGSRASLRPLTSPVGAEAPAGDAPFSGLLDAGAPGGPVPTSEADLGGRTRPGDRPGGRSTRRTVELRPPQRWSADPVTEPVLRGGPRGRALRPSPLPCRCGRRTVRRRRPRVNTLSRDPQGCPRPFSDVPRSPPVLHPLTTGHPQAGPTVAARVFARARPGRAGLSRRGPARRRTGRRRRAAPVRSRPAPGSAPGPGPRSSTATTGALASSTASRATAASGRPPRPATTGMATNATDQQADVQEPGAPVAQAHGQGALADLGVAGDVPQVVGDEQRGGQQPDRDRRAEAEPARARPVCT